MVGCCGGRGVVQWRLWAPPAGAVMRVYSEWGRGRCECAGGVHCCCGAEWHSPCTSRPNQPTSPCDHCCPFCPRPPPPPLLSPPTAPPHAPLTPLSHPDQTILLCRMSKLERDKQKLIQDKCQQILTELLRDEDNKYCVDCDSKGTSVCGQAHSTISSSYI